jgi:hypothetical protein
MNAIVNFCFSFSDNNTRLSVFSNGQTVESLLPDLYYTNGRVNRVSRRAVDPENQVSDRKFQFDVLPGALNEPDICLLAHSEKILEAHLDFQRSPLRRGMLRTTSSQSTSPAGS